MQSRSARPESISIHALREEGDVEMSGMSHFDVVFLSTPSARRATWSLDDLQPAEDYFYPRPPRGGRRYYIVTGNARVPFLSTPSARRATTPQEEHTQGDKNFYPRPPRGGRPSVSIAWTTTLPFLSTPSARRATVPDLLELLPGTNFYPRPPRGGRLLAAMIDAGYIDISIHALREEGDIGEHTTRSGTTTFLSTPSARRATICPLCEWQKKNNFYPRPPRGGRRCGLDAAAAEGGISIHALREEGDHLKVVLSSWFLIFLSTPSARRATLSSP